MNDNVIWKPQPRQAAFMSRSEPEVLYGGSAGGGKSDALVIEALRQVHIPYYKCLILRKTFPQLRELIDKTLLYYPKVFPDKLQTNFQNNFSMKISVKFFTFLFDINNIVNDELKCEVFDSLLNLDKASNSKEK